MVGQNTPAVTAVLNGPVLCNADRIDLSEYESIALSIEMVFNGMYYNAFSLKFV